MQDFARRHRGGIKTPSGTDLGRVAKLFPEEGYGFLESLDDLRDLLPQEQRPRRRLRFAFRSAARCVSMEMGAKGPQASTVALGAQPRTIPS